MNVYSARPLCAGTSVSTDCEIVESPFITNGLVIMPEAAGNEISPVGVAVGVGVGVAVGVAVAVAVAVGLGVAVAVAVGVEAGVGVGEGAGFPVASGCGYV